MTEHPWFHFKETVKCLDRGDGGPSYLESFHCFSQMRHPCIVKLPLPQEAIKSLQAVASNESGSQPWEWKKQNITNN